MTSPVHQQHNQRAALDKLFALDSVVSVLFGVVSLGAPHVLIAEIGGGSYNHAVHETLRYVILSPSVRMNVRDNIYSMIRLTF
jgi:hypothetical protein